MNRLLPLSIACLAALTAAAGDQAQDEEYLQWSSAQVEAVGKSAYRQGRVGGIFDTRLLKTERAYNYKLAATWLTPEVIRATARMHQLRSRLTDGETRELVREAESSGLITIIVDIDPREGSGVIPADWESFLQPKARSDRSVRGTINQKLRDVKALSGVLRRNYDYDRFWVTFAPAKDGTPLFRAGDGTAELVVRIREREGRVEWPVPPSMPRGI